MWLIHMRTISASDNWSIHQLQFLRGANDMAEWLQCSMSTMETEDWGQFAGWYLFYSVFSTFLAF